MKLHVLDPQPPVICPGKLQHSSNKYYVAFLGAYPFSQNLTEPITCQMVCSCSLRQPDSQTETHLAGSLLPACLCLLLSLASLLLLKLANETRTVLLNQAHLDSPVVGF